MQTRSLGPNKLVVLTKEDLAAVDRAASEITVHGARYPEHLERLTGR